MERSSQTSISSSGDDTTSQKILIFPASSVVPCWIDPDFNVQEKGDNNFQDAPNNTMRVHLNMATWIWRKGLKILT